MPEYYIHPFWLLGATQIAIFLFVATGYFWFKSKSASKKITVEKHTTYTAYLDKEIEIADGLPELAEEESAESQKNMLELRRGILDLERVTYSLGTESGEFQKQYSTSLQRLLEQYVHVELNNVEEEKMVDEAPVEADNVRGTIDTYESEFKSLKDIIKNQYDAMKSLREQLEENGGDIESIEEINKVLRQVEQENEVIDGNIEKLETSSQTVIETEAEEGDLLLDAEESDTVSMDEMTEIVSGQQKNIDSLRGLIASLDEDQEKPLESSMANIERSNSELSNCLVYLVDENDALRSRLNDSQGDTGVAASDELDGKQQAAFEVKIKALETQLLDKDQLIHNLQEKLERFEPTENLEASDLDL
ncbi:MAG: hypothetical protein V3V12_09945 [Gammaproteobacteria bacterium]